MHPSTCRALRSILGKSSPAPFGHFRLTWMPDRASVDPSRLVASLFPAFVRRTSSFKNFHFLKRIERSNQEATAADGEDARRIFWHAVRDLAHRPRNLRVSRCDCLRCRCFVSRQAFTPTAEGGDREGNDVDGHLVITLLWPLPALDTKQRRLGKRLSGDDKSGSSTHSNTTVDNRQKKPRALRVGCTRIFAAPRLRLHFRFRNDCSDYRIPSIFRGFNEVPPADIHVSIAFRHSDIFSRRCRCRRRHRIDGRGSVGTLGRAVDSEIH
eukprot:284815367_3